jgi:hypothetical protein
MQAWTPDQQRMSAALHPGHGGARSITAVQQVIRWTKLPSDH